MKCNIHILILCLAALVCCNMAFSQNQDAPALLAEVWKVHGVTASLLDAQVQLHGLLRRGEGTGGQDDTLLIIQRGHSTVRFEAQGKAGKKVSALYEGFRWSRKDNDPVVDYDGRYSINLPFMDSPSTGLLAYLLANASRITYFSKRQDTLDGIAVIRLVLKVSDANPDRVRIRSPIDRSFELIVDSASRQLMLAALLATPESTVDRENYRYSDYLNEERVLFPGKVIRSSGSLSGPYSSGPSVTLLIRQVQFNQIFKDNDFKRP
jgi:hypothetical protein